MITEYWISMTATKIEFSEKAGNVRFSLQIEGYSLAYKADIAMLYY